MKLTFRKRCGKIKTRKIKEDVSAIHLESILDIDLEQIISKYDQYITISLQKREYAECEDYLSDFCFDLLLLSEQEQVFVARTFFISIVTDIIRAQNRRNILHPRRLSYSYEAIAKIEKWENISEFILGIPWYVTCLRENIIADQILFEGNMYVEKALQLIHFHLEGDILSVGWLAQKLGISTTHLSNLFKLQIGETVSNYITKRKLDEITFELTYTNKPLNEIREKYGFMNHSNFIQHFKKHIGMTPLQFKQEKFK